MKRIAQGAARRPGTVGPTSDFNVSPVRLAQLQRLGEEFNRERWARKPHRRATFEEAPPSAAVARRLGMHSQVREQLIRRLP